MKDTLLGTLALAIVVVLASGYLLFAMALDCKHPKFSGAPYCALVRR